MFKDDRFGEVGKIKVDGGQDELDAESLKKIITFK
jgi:hypothetical protein